MPHVFTEDQLVEQPAVGLFAEQQALIFRIQNLRRTRGLLQLRLLSGQVELGTN